MKYYYLIEDHIDEVKYRMLYVTISFITIFIISNMYIYEIIYVLSGNLINSLIFTDLTESFTSQIELSFYIALILSFPSLIINIWLFTKPGLYYSENNKFTFFLVLTMFLYFLNIYLVIYIILPSAMHFFIQFQYLNQTSILEITYLPRMKRFLSFSYKIFFSFLVILQIPTLLILLFYYKIITLESMIKYRKYFILFAFILATIISPPDLASQFFIALPLILCYESTIFWILVFNKVIKNHRLSVI